MCKNGRNYFIERFNPTVLNYSGNKINKLTVEQVNEIIKNLEKEIFKVLNEWADKHPKLIPILPDYATYILPKQIRIYKYMK